MDLVYEPTFDIYVERASVPHMTNHTHSWETSRAAKAIRTRMHSRNIRMADLLTERGWLVIDPDRKEKTLITIAQAIQKARLQNPHNNNQHINQIEKAITELLNNPWAIQEHTPLD